MYKILSLFSLIFIIGTTNLTAQNYPKTEADPFDFGKMWTFEHAPLDYFEKTYNFRPTEEWLKKARMASLRFSGYCSASFISPSGLVLTNHHCSRGEVGKVMKEGENFDKNGFYAEKQGDERRVEGLFVKQLAQIADITDFVKGYTNLSTSDDDFKVKQTEAFEAAKNDYLNKDGWAGLELETVTYYNGGKYSLYGYKRYTDVRLVLIPELDLGFFGGDPDNFTYPRYNLDFTLWRVYGDDGKPLNTSQMYFEVNPDGIEEGTSVFLVGNPGSTERYRTVDQLEYDRDYRYKIFVDVLSNRKDIMQAEYDKNPSHEALSMILNFSNSIKAINGIIGGMNNPRLMGKKQAVENEVKSKSTAVKNGNDYWKELANEMKAMEPYAMESRVLAPSQLSGAAMLLAHYTARFREAKENGGSAEDLEALKTQITTTAKKLEDPVEEKYLATLLAEMKQYAKKDDKYVGKILDKRSPEVAAKEIIEDTKFTNEKKLNKLLDGKTKKLEKNRDPILEMANVLVPAYKTAAEKIKSSQAKREGLQEKIGGEVFKVYGLSIPPDATFTLRLADGVVKRYNYNGTTAPYQTTYFGLYDRHFSNNGQFPWSLPQRWLNKASMEFMKKPLNFISTSDSIGGNSGSPIINKEGQVVGLLFDGNIESLPGNFIYDSEVNRSVGVHLGGITAAMQYIFGADRVLKEMVKK